MVAPDLGVGAPLGALLLHTVGLADGGVEVDGERPISRTQAQLPGSAQGQLTDLLQLPAVTIGEGAEEGTQGGGGEDAMTQDFLHPGRPQAVSLADAVATRQLGGD